MSTENPPVLSENLELELSQLIARSTELNTECLAVNRRIRELHEQVAQMRRNAEAGEHPPAGAPPRGATA